MDDGWVDRSLFPFESRYLELGGARVHYVDEGTGPTVLFLHGNPTWSFVYREIIAALRDRCRCVALDYPGFGLSTAGAGYGYTPVEHADVVGKFIDTLDLRDFTPVMQDWGGPIGIAATLDRQDRLKAMIIGNTWAWPRTDNATQRFSAALGDGKSGEFLVDRANVFVNVFVRRAMRRRSPSGREMAMWRGPFPDQESRLPVRVFPRELTGSAEFLASVETRLGEISDRPTLLFWADQDPAFRGTERRRWESILSNRLTYELRHVGHYWQDDAGPEAALMIRYWWDQVFDD